MPSTPPAGLPAWLALPALLLSLIAVPAAHAQTRPAGASAVVRVVVEVPRVMHMHLISQPRSVEVTPDDVARGWVEAPFEMRMAVDSNSREGYSLMVVNHGTFVDHAQVSGLGADLHLRPGAVTVPRAAAGRGLRRDVVALAVRLALAADTRPGSYPWPIQVAAVNP